MQSAINGVDPALLEEALEVRARARLLVPAAEVAQALTRMAAEITAAVGGSAPVVLTVMHGGVFAAVELCRRFRFPYEFDYVHVSSYGASLTSGALEWHVRPRAGLAGRTVLLVDDVLDRGATLAALLEGLAGAGCARVYTAVLVVKRLPNAPPRPHVDFAGLEVGDEYLFGCGMDYKGYWRGLPELYVAEGDHWQPISG